MIAYADDITLLHHVNDQHADTLQDDVNTFSNCAAENNLRINTSKTKSFLFSRDNHTQVPAIFVDGQAVERLNSIKLLGVYFPSNMKWLEQISHVYKKSLRSLSYIRRLHQLGLPHQTLWHIYNAIVYCHLSYCWPVWCDTTITEFKKNRACWADCFKVVQQAIFCFGCEDASESMLYEAYEKNSKEQWSSSATILCSTWYSDQLEKSGSSHSICAVSSFTYFLFLL